MMTASQPISPRTQQIAAFEKNLQKYRARTANTLQDHLNMLQWIGKLYDFTPGTAKQNEVIQIINGVYQNGLQSDPCEHHVQLNNNKLFALIMCGAIELAYEEYIGLVHRGLDYTDITTHTIMLSALCEEHDSELSIGSDDSIYQTIKLLKLEQDNKIIEQRIKEVYNIAIASKAVIKDAKLHLLMMNWAAKTKDRETVDFVYKIVKENNISNLKISQSFALFTSSLSALEMLAPASSEDTDSSEEKTDATHAKVTKESILLFCDLFEQICLDNQEDLLKEHFHQALDICPPQHCRELYITTIQVAGSCQQIEFAWEIFQHAQNTEFFDDLNIMSTILIAVFNNKEILTALDIQKVYLLYKKIHAHPGKIFIDKSIYISMIAIWNDHKNIGMTYEVYMDAMHIGNLYKEIDIHREAMMGAAQNGNKWILEAIEKEACNKLKDHHALLNEVKSIYQKAREILCDNLAESVFHLPPSSTISADFKYKTEPLCRSYSQRSQATVVEEEELYSSEEDINDEYDDTYNLVSPASNSIFARRQAEENKAVQARKQGEGICNSDTPIPDKQIISNQFR